MSRIDRKIELWHQKNTLNYILKFIKEYRDDFEKSGVDDRSVFVALDEIASFISGMIQEIEEIK